jgi:hypothetical protein
MAEAVVRSVRGLGLLGLAADGRALLLDDLRRLLIALTLRALSTPHALQASTLLLAVAMYRTNQ